MSRVVDQLCQSYQCPRCHQQGAHGQELAMSGTGLSRLLEIQPYRYAFISCNSCGHTEIYDLTTLAGRDDLGTFLEILFHD